MSHNSFGHLFRVTTWGESHGPALGCVIDGCPPLIDIDEAFIQQFLDERKPGQSKHTTQRKEPDIVEILSGVFEGKTTGTPICLMIRNQDQRSKDYGEIKDTYRPGHADYTYIQKYGIRDYRGGGRSSARETASRVAAGAVARKVLGASIEIKAALVQIGEHSVDESDWDWRNVKDNPFFSPSENTAKIWDDYLSNIRKQGLSIGAVVEVHAYGVPAGWGAPVYGKLDSDLAMALMSINAVKGVEIGAGFNAAKLTGLENADRIRIDKEGNASFQSNHAGGILGGISSGQPIVARFAVKPTSSILQPVETITRTGKETEIITKGRHDPCVGIRAVPVAEAMMACVLADHKLRHRAQTGDNL